MRTPLKKLTMYNKVKELSREGLSIRQISRNTGLDRVTVRKYLRMTEEEFSDFLALQKQRNRKLQTYEEFIKKRVTDYPDCSAAQVEDWLIFNFRLHGRRVNARKPGRFPAFLLRYPTRAVHQEALRNR
jgi:transposase